MKSGFYSMSNEDYHKEEAVSKSDLELFHRSPAHYKAKELKEPTPAMVFGAAFHTFVLQPELFEKEYAVMPKDLKLTTIEGKAFAMTEQGNHRELIKWNDYQIMRDMMISLADHDTAIKLLQSKGPREISAFWTDKRIGLECKLRADLITSESNVVVDLKTTVDARPEVFMRQAANLHYHWQASHYLGGITAITGVEHKDFIIIAVEKEPPYAVAVYHFDDAMIYCGEEELKILMDRMKECKEKDEWPGYQDEIQPISLPEWYFKKATL